MEYIVTETLAGRGERLKGYNVAFGGVRSLRRRLIPTSIPSCASRPRACARSFANITRSDGEGDPIRISLPKGTYTPHIEFRRAPTLDPRPDRAAPTKQLGMLAGAVLLIIAAGLWGLQYGGLPGPSLPDKPSVAVLPFDNIGADPKWDRLADGMTDDVITDLSHSKDLVVIARNSTELYKGKPIDIRQIGRDLKVKYVLEGSIQSMGDHIRVNAQLIEVASGGHVWSERYDRPADDLFVVQNDVAQKIAATLTGYAGGVFGQAERRFLKRKPPASLSAFDTYLLGIEAEYKVTKESLIEAEGLFRKALQLDPQLARAYVNLVDVQTYLIDLGFAPSVEEALSKMMEAGEKAVQLDPDDGATHYALGLAYNFHGKLEQALAEFDRAEALSPSDADLLLNIAWAISCSREAARAVSLSERSLALEPSLSRL